MSDLPEYLTKAGLKARGWTEKAIAMFLGDCDREVKNPIFRSAAPAKLYLTSRVEGAEQSDAYRAFVAGNAGRRGGVLFTQDVLAAVARWREEGA